jgi:hypothetical protein
MGGRARCSQARGGYGLSVADLRLERGPSASAIRLHNARDPAQGEESEGVLLLTLQLSPATAELTTGSYRARLRLFGRGS